MPRPDLLPAALPEKPWQPETWTARHEMICDLHLAAYDNNAIATKLEMSASRVSIILSDPRAEEYVRRHRARMQEAFSGMIMERLESLAPFALDAIEDDIKIENPSVRERPIRQKAAFGALAALGYGPVQKQVTATVKDVPAELVDRTRRTLEEMRGIQGRYQFEAPPLAEIASSGEGHDAP